MCTLLLFVTLAAPAEALAAKSAIELRDVPGTHGNWHEGTVIVPAQPAQVEAWLTDYDHWRGRFPDIEWSQRLGVDEHGRNIVRFRSRLAGRTFVVHEAVKPGLLVFDGWAPNVYTQGRIYLLPTGDGRTRVIMQSSAQVHGFVGMFATRGYRRKSAFAAITSHLRALLDLASAK